MFGLGYMELLLILVVLILVFGGTRVGRTLGKSYRTYQKVDRAKRKFTLAGLLGLDKQDK